MGLHSAFGSDHFFSLSNVKDQIREDFEKLRHGTHDYWERIMRISDALGHDMITLGEFDSSEDELPQLHLLGRKAAARVFLLQLRVGTANYEEILSKLRHELNHCAPDQVLKLDDMSFNSSEEELSALCVRGAQIAARELIDLDECMDETQISE